MYTLGGLRVLPRAALASVKPPSPCSPCPLAMDDFFGLEGEVLEPPPPLIGSKKRSGRGSKARSEQSMQTPAKGEQPLQLKLSARDREGLQLLWKG